MSTILFRAESLAKTDPYREGPLMTRIRAAAIFSLALFAAGVALSLGSPAVRAQSANSACFYADDHFSGRRLCLDAGQSRSSLGSFNDQISSVQIPPGVVVQVCQDDNFRGRCVRLDRSVPRLSDMRFNDQISSI
ncbi:MAG TPA: peptidase inhibitor family I36 protein, partial [Mycobacterium sp.]|nr:peptidase inhibitor family I36 protein [Mycobacterium sp.]